jgi:hypothetical protein
MPVRRRIGELSYVSAREKTRSRYRRRRGVAPAGTCAAGDTAAVPYSADYFFWKAVGGDESGD